MNYTCPYCHTIYPETCMDCMETIHKEIEDEFLKEDVALFESSKINIASGEDVCIPSY
jgi:hypothetical protein